ncbi:MAG: hypothetical protein KDI19_10710 [Pseudomonadales bacterium]|nr:hypothetical protein [Pseudomonadales bacterium]
MAHTLEARYRGATLTLEIEPGEAASLRINGLVRERQPLGQSVVRLSSTVQTDYEWHEFIEGIVTPGTGQIEARLVANNQELAHEAFGV